MNWLKPSALTLDDASLDPASLSMAALMREQELAKRPAGPLIWLTRVFQSQRQARGLGWSRPWNRTGLTVFRVHRQHPIQDGDYFTPAITLLDQCLGEAPQAYRDFAAELMNDPERVAFTFYHNRTAETGRQYEGLTLSLGRRFPANPRRLDRLDIMLEDQRLQGRVDGEVDRLQILVCPWRTYQNGRVFHHLDTDRFTTAQSRLAQALYRNCVERYHDWKSSDARQRSPWSARIVDHFAPRTFIPQNSSFT